MKPLEVLVVSPPTTVWGAQLRLLDYAPALADRGVHLTLGCPPDGDLHSAWTSRGLTHRDVALPDLAGIRDPESGRRPPPHELAATMVQTARGANAIARAIAGFDAVWSFNLRSHPAAVAAARLRRVPVAIEIVDIVRPGFGRWLLQLCAARADLTIANSAATGATLNRRARELRIVHPGVDTDRFRPGSMSRRVRNELAEGGSILVGIAGRIDPHKGVDVLIDAVAHLPTELDVRLAVIGDVGVANGRYARELEARARKQLGPRARFVGRRSDMPDVLRALDILVNASTAEPFGRSVLEAQATGVAVIGTRQGGIPEFVIDRDTGLLVEPGDVRGLTLAITELAADPGLRAHLGAAARRQAVERFKIGDRYDLVAELLRGLARRR